MWVVVLVALVFSGFGFGVLWLFCGLLREVVVWLGRWFVNFGVLD